MGKEQFETGKAPLIHVAACDGDAVIRGWKEPTLQVKGAYEVEETAEGYHLSGHGDLRLYVPEMAEVTIEEVSGDLVLKTLSGKSVVGHVHGNTFLVEAGTAAVETIHGNLVARGAAELSVGQVHGDTSLRRVGSLAARAIFGDLSARRITGSLTIEEASGDVSLREISGDVAIGHAHRDVNLVGLSGRATLGEVDGDVRLRGALPPGEHALSAHGDIVVRWPANVPLHVAATGRRVVSRLSLQQVAEKEGYLVGSLGEGGTQLTLAADGEVILKELSPMDEKWEPGMEGEDFGFEAAFSGLELDNVAARIEAEVNQHLARVANDVAARFGPEFGQRLAEKASRQAERAAERAERARRKAEWRGRAGQDAAAAGPAPQRRTASPEEQLKILKMVEAGTISPEEAGMLLEALEA